MRSYRLALIAAAAVMTAVACNDSSVGPRQPSARRAPETAPLSRNPVTAQADAPESYEFDIPTAGAVIALGDRFTLTVPANAVCDPASSSYGVGHWDDSCTIIDRSVNVHAKIWTNGSRVYLDFSPSLRFSPSTVVTLSTNLVTSVLAGRTDLAGNQSALAGYALLYSPDGGKTRVNEVSALGDRSLVTHIDLVTGVMWRRIKHFSGYITPYGEPCEPEYPGDPYCVWDPDSVEGGP